MMLTLVFADALTLPAQGDPNLTARAARLFAKFQLSRIDEPSQAVVPEMPWERYLRELFSVAPASSIEAASAYLDAAPLPCWRVTPVHLHAGLDHLLLSSPKRLELSSTHADELTAAIRPVLDDAGLRLMRVTPHRWYLLPRDDAQPAAALDWKLTANGWRAANGRNIDAYSPAGADARAWRRLLNEVQMTWHGHALNEARAAADLLTLNSLWLDGRPPGFPSPRAAADHLDTAIPDIGLTSHAPLAGLFLGAGLKPAGAVTEGGSFRCFTSPALANGAERAQRALMFDPKFDVKFDPQIDPKIDPTAAQSEGDREASIDSLWSHIEYRVTEVMQTRGLADSALPANSIGPIDRLRVVLCGERKRVELEWRPTDRWKFWRTIDARPWFEWSDRDH